MLVKGAFKCHIRSPEAQIPHLGLGDSERGGKGSG